MSVATMFLLGSLTLAIACGFVIATTLVSLHRESVYKRSVIVGDDEGDGGRNKRFHIGRTGIETSIVDLIKKIEAKSSMGAKPSKDSSPKRRRGSKDVEDRIRLAGLRGEVSDGSVREASILLLAIGATLGFVIGLVFSVELAAVLALVGAAIGALMPTRALKSRVAKRSADAERHLPEMLDVMALCMRSGLSIDASIAIYSRHFDTMLAQELECARRKWSSGLERREEALRSLASTYDSVILGRVVDTVVRSARYGSSMISSLESDAREARSAYRATREEKIAKAPVKMMVPTGVLILPAMLIMVLGPVLLELMEGGF